MAFAPLGVCRCVLLNICIPELLSPGAVTAFDLEQPEDLRVLISWTRAQPLHRVLHFAQVPIGLRHSIACLFGDVPKRERT